ncbi:dTDP-4-amino-4,6-dideoxyglucose formyltransferase [Vibrio celticus]|uniref:Linear gramicidin synthase subunit A n=1 Tax=Vibrio celticus TaxID=446372 RepID=A0A1C3JC06_9VIBR|nr:dTDP-4-amino-4,6-dideoxyglucose formyltransferase [Vibrio celticus]SBT12664.1 Linear gramicidin synthase subunit A [Vibrio celticus]
MINLLVVSDNVELVCHIKKVSINLVEEVDIDYCYSSINKSPEILINLGMKEVNVKDESVVSYLIKKYDLIISAHCKQIFPESLVEGIRCLNIHPGLNPYNRGWFPQVFSIVNKKPVGCTIHVMDKKVDHGSIIYQREVEIEAWDTSYDVYNKVIEQEKKLITNNLSDLINGNYCLENMYFEGNYNSISDFKEMSELKLNSTGTLSEHIDLLRSLTHGDYKNAFFIDGNGSKVFVSINLEKE